MRQALISWKVLMGASTSLRREVGEGTRRECARFPSGDRCAHSRRALGFLRTAPTEAPACATNTTMAPTLRRPVCARPGLLTILRGSTTFGARVAAVVLVVALVVMGCPSPASARSAPSDVTADRDRGVDGPTGVAPPTDDIYFAPTYGDPPSGSGSGPQDTSAYARAVASTLARRMMLAEQKDETLDVDRIPLAERQALAYVNEIHDFIHGKQKLVVVADVLNVRRVAGRVGGPPLDRLRMGDVVYLCGHTRARTKPSADEVVWYWIDQHGDCDRSKPKMFVASREVEDGRQHVLVSKHDYDPRTFRRKRVQAEREGWSADIDRYKGRIWVAGTRGSIEIDRTLWDEIMRAFIRCVGASLSLRMLRRGLGKLMGNTRASIAEFLGNAGAAATGTEAAQLAAAFAAGLASTLARRAGVVLSTGICVATRTYYGLQARKRRRDTT